MCGEKVIKVRKIFVVLFATGLLCVDRATAYTVYGAPFKWGDSSTYGTPGGTVSWSIVPGAWTSLMPGDLVSDITAAFATWSAASNGNINFRQVTDDGRAPGPGDNLVNGQNGDNAGDIRFWGANNAGWIGVSYGPKNYWGPDWMGDVMFNTDYFPWADVFFIALHEIGHSLGLGHSENGGAVMYPYYWGQTIGALPQDDVNAIRYVYDPTYHGPGPYVAPVPEPTSFLLFLVGGMLICIYGQRRVA
jgi:hypothetical protein